MIRIAPDEMALMLDWAKAKLSFPVTTSKFPTGQLKVLSQGWGHCMVNRSIESEHLSIGKRTFKRGLGTHTPSEIIVHLPAPGKTFKGWIGRDQNPIVRPERSDITFTIEVAGQEIYRSKTFHGGETPVAVSVPLAGATEFTLRVVGETNFGHADWAEAHVILQNGKKLWLDELPFSGLELDLTPEPPFNFLYNGKPFREVYKSWNMEWESQKREENQTRHTLRYHDPETKLSVACQAVVYHDFPAVEWVLYFENNGTQDTPILENIQTLDTTFRRTEAEREITLLTTAGSECTSSDFQPREQKLNPKDIVNLGGVGGRASTKHLPFMNLMAEDGGVILAVGWSGQWSASLTRDEKAGVSVRTGLERTHFKLHPGEQVRTPRNLLLFWKGDRVRSQNLFRHFILEHGTPRPNGNGKLLQSPITHGNWGMVHEKVHLKRIRSLIKGKVPFDYYWIDAGWYGDCQKMEDWWPQAGNWSINRKLYPNGFKPLSKLLHKNGKGLLLWFDCERAMKGSQTHQDHPDWLIDLENDNVMLLDLGIPQAREWLTDYISGMIDEEGIDVYRQDSNIDPLPFWQKNDAPDRQGISEMKHIEGLYLFWDELLRRHPHLVIDNCCSGGRRIDLETTRRSVPLWRSDLQCSPWYNPTGSQCQTFGLSTWIPLHSTGAHGTGDLYDFRSAVSSGLSSNWPGVERPDFPIAWMKKVMTEAAFLREYHYGSFYPLTTFSLNNDVWLAYQLDRSDLGKGVILAYRREDCPYPILSVKLHDLDPAAIYEVKGDAGFKTQRFTGKNLMARGLDLYLKNPKSSILVTYSKKG